MKNWLIQYSLYNDRKLLIRGAKVKVYGNSSSHANERLRRHLSDLYWDYHELQIHSTEEIVLKTAPPKDDFDSIFGGVFGNIFKPKKP